MLAFRGRHLVPLLTKDRTSLKGGFYAEGWNYGQLATHNILLPGLALESSGLIPSAAAERRWATEAIRHLVSAQPTVKTVYDGGNWYAYPAPFPRKYLFSCSATWPTTPPRASMPATS